MRSLICATVVVCLATLLAAQTPPPSSAQSQSQEQPTFRGGSDLVRVFVTVMDRDGRLVTTLNKDDFQVRDNGKPQSITTFDNSPLPIRLIVMLDCSGSMSGNLQLLRAASEQLFTRLRPDDGARVGSFGEDVTISSTFSRDPRSLRDALPSDIPPNAPTPLWRAIDEAMNGLKGVKEQAGEPRPVILVMTDGKDSGPIGFQRHYVSQVDVIDRARAEGVMIYGVGMRSRPSHPQQPGIGPGGLMATLTADMPDPGLARVAEDTGGGYAEIRYGQDLGAAFAHVADELHSQYLVGYPPPAKDGKVHSIDVKLTQRGLQARARKNYTAAKS
jgi:Ca-activated chloride channel homolog